MKKSTRFLSLILTVAVLMTLCFVTATSETTDFELILDAPESVIIGEEFTVSVKIPAGFALSSARVMVVFDEAMLEVVDAKAGAFLTGFMASINKNYNRNGVRGVRGSFAIDEKSSEDGGELMSVTFKAIATGSTVVKTADCNFYDGQDVAEKYTYTDVEKTISIGQETTTSTTVESTTSTTESTTSTTVESTTSTTIIDNPTASDVFSGDFKVIVDAPESVIVGEEFTVSVKVPEGFVISSCRVMVVFDEDILEVVDAKQGSFLAGFSGSINKNYNKNGYRGVRGSFAGAENTSADGGEVMTVTFKALATGKTVVSTADCNFYDGKEAAEKYSYGDDEKSILINEATTAPTESTTSATESTTSTTESTTSTTESTTSTTESTTSTTESTTSTTESTTSTTESTTSTTESTTSTTESTTSTTEPTTSTSVEDTTSATEPSVEYKLELKDGAMAVLTEEYVYISSEKMTAEEVIYLFKNEGVIVEGKDAVDITSTGEKVQLIVDGNVVDQVEVVLLGDIDGDGMITVTDILIVKKALLQLYNLSGANYAAADIDMNDTIDTTDYANVRLYFLHLTSIEEWLNLSSEPTAPTEAPIYTTRAPITEPASTEPSKPEIPTEPMTQAPETDPTSTEPSKPEIPTEPITDETIWDQ